MSRQGLWLLLQWVKAEWVRKGALENVAKPSSQSYKHEASLSQVNAHFGFSYAGSTHTLDSFIWVNAHFGFSYAESTCTLLPLCWVHRHFAFSKMSEHSLCLLLCWVNTHFAFSYFSYAESTRTLPSLMLSEHSLCLLLCWVNAHFSFSYLSQCTLWLLLSESMHTLASLIWVNAHFGFSYLSQCTLWFLLCRVNTYFGSSYCMLSQRRMRFPLYRGKYSEDNLPKNG